MSVITFDVYKDIIKKHDGFIPSTAEKNYTKLLFRFKENDDWTKCSIITASFFISADGIVKSDAELLKDNLTVEFSIPPEFTGEKGNINLGLQASYIDESGKEITIATNIITVNRNNGVIVNAKANTELYEKIILLVQDYFNGDKEQIDNFINSFVKPSSTQLIKLADSVIEIDRLTITVKDNHVSIKGTSTERVNADIKVDRDFLKFEANEDYVVSFQNVQCNKVANKYDGMFIWTGTDDNKHILIPQKDSSTIINTQTEKDMHLKWNLSPGEWDMEFDFMIEPGKEVSGFEPFFVVRNLGNKSVDFGKLSLALQNMINSKAKSSMFLKQSKTQLINLEDTEITVGDFTLSINNNHIKIFGTLETAFNKYINICDGINVLKSNTEYTLSVQNVIDNTSDLDYVTMSIWDKNSNSDSQSIQIIGSDKNLLIQPPEDKKLQFGFNIPAGTYDKEFDFKIEFGAETTSFEPFYVVGNVGNNSIGIDKLDDEVTDRVKSIENKASYYKVEDITGETVSGYYNALFSHNSESKWECTADILECKPGDIFRVTSTIGKGFYGDPHAVVCYDSNKNFLSKHFGLKDDKITSYCQKIFIVPENAKYIAFNSWLYKDTNGTDLYKLVVEKITPYTEREGIIASSLVASSSLSEFWNEEMLSVGDSIAQGAKIGNCSYVHLFAEKYNIKLTDEAVGGTTLAVHLNSNGEPDGTSIYERLVANTSKKKYGIVFCEGVTNDITELSKGKLKLGKITDGIDEEFDTTTILGALEAICLHLNTTQLTAKKLFVFVTNRVELLKLTKEVQAEMKKVLNKYGIPYIDLSNITSLGIWNSDIQKEFYVDDIHPNFEAHKKFYFPAVERALLYGGNIGSGCSASTSSGNGSYNLTEADINTIANKVIENFIDVSEVGL